MYTTKVFFTSISWEAKEIIACDFYYYSSSFIPISRSLSTMLPCLLMQSKWFSYLHLLKIIWALSLVLLLSIVGRAPLIAVGGNIFFLNPSMSKCGHLSLQDSTSSMLPQCIHMDRAAITPSQSYILVGLFMLCTSIWTKDAQMVGIDSLQERGGRKRLLVTSAMGQFYCIINWKKILFFSPQSTDGDVTG